VPDIVTATDWSVARRMTRSIRSIGKTGSVLTQLPLPRGARDGPRPMGATSICTTNGRSSASISVVERDLGTPAGDAVYARRRQRRYTVRARTRRPALDDPVDAPDAATSHTLDIVATAGRRRLASGRPGRQREREVLLVDPRAARSLAGTRSRPIEEPPLVATAVVVVAGRGNIHTYR